MTQRQSMSKAESISLGFRHTVWEMGVFCREAWLVYSLHFREMLVLCVAWFLLGKGISTASDALGPDIPLGRFIFFGGMAWIILRFTFSLYKFDIVKYMISYRKENFYIFQKFAFIFFVFILVDYSIIYLGNIFESFINSNFDIFEFLKLLNFSINAGSAYVFILISLDTVMLLIVMMFVSVSVSSVVVYGGGVSTFLTYLGRRALWLMPRLIIPIIGLYLMSWLFLIHSYLIHIALIIITIFGAQLLIANWRDYTGFVRHIARQARRLLSRAISFLFAFLFSSLIIVYSGQADNIIEQFYLNINSSSMIDNIYSIFFACVIMAIFIGIYMFWIFVLAYISVIAVCALEQDRGDGGPRTVQGLRVASDTV